MLNKLLYIKRPYWVFILLLSSSLFLNSCSSYKAFRNRGKVTTKKDLKQERKQTNFTSALFEGSKQKMLGNFSNSIKWFERCAAIEPQSAVAYYELADVLVKNKQFEEAIPYAEKAVKFEPDNYWYQSFLAALYYNSHLNNKGNKVLEQMIALFPEKKNIYTELFTNYIKDNDIDEALNVIERFEKQFGKKAFVTEKKVGIYLFQKKYKKAIQEVKAEIKAHPERKYNYVWLGDVYFESGNLEKALQCYEKVRLEQPDYGMVYFALSRYYEAKQDEDKMFVNLKQWFLADDVGEEIKLQFLSSVFKTANWTEKEMEWMADILAVAEDKYPESLLLNALLVDCYIKKKDVKKAQEYLLRLTDKGENKKEIWEQILYIDSDLAQYDSLLIHAKKMIEYYPNQPNGYFFAGLGAFYTQKNEQAVQFFNDGIDFVLEDSVFKSQFYGAMGDAYHRLKQHKQSDEAYDKAIAYNPYNYYVCNNYAYYLSMRAKDLDKALKLIKKCVRQNPKSATFLDTYAWVLFKQKKYKKALEMIEKAYQSLGEEKSAAIVEHFGDILFHLNQPQEALEKWKEAESIGKGSSVLKQKIETEKYMDYK